MREIEYYIDFKSDFYNYKSCMQNDDIGLRIIVHEDGKPLMLTGASANLNWLKPNGIPLVKKGVEVVENTLVCALDREYTGVSGKVKFEIEITQNGTATIFPLELHVRDKIFQSESVDNTINKILETVQIDDKIDQFLNDTSLKIDNFKTILDEFKEQIKVINGYNATTYNFLRYGGKANDETFDNRAVFQSLVDTIAENGGGTIYIPEGTYFFGRTEGTEYSVLWKSNVSVKGAGMGKTILKIGNGDISDGEGYSLFYRKKDVLIENSAFESFTIDGYNMTINNSQGYTHKGKGLFFEGADNCVFRDLEILGTPSTGFGVDFINNCIIDNVNCDDCGRLWIENYDNGRGGTIEGPGGAGIGVGTGLYDPENLKIVNCTCTNCGHYGIFLEHQGIFTPSVYKAESKGNVIANNIVHNNRYGGIGIRGGSDITIIGNTIYKNKYGVILDSGEKGDLDVLMLKNIILANNTITDNIEDGIKIDKQTIFDGININGNIIKNNQKYGIDFSSEKVVLKEKRNNLIIEGNVIVDNGSDMYIANGTGTKNMYINPSQFQNAKCGQAYFGGQAYAKADKYLLSNFSSFEISFKLGSGTTFPCCLFSNRDENYNSSTQVKGYSIIIDENKKINLTYCEENGSKKQSYIFNEVLPIDEKITLKFYKNASSSSITAICTIGEEQTSLTSSNTEDLYTFFINMFTNGTNSTIDIGREWQGSLDYGKYIKDVVIYSLVVMKESTQELKYGFSNIGIDKKVIELNNSGLDIACYGGVKQQLNTSI